MQGLSAVVLSINNDLFIKLITQVICVTYSGSALESLQLFQVGAAQPSLSIYIYILQIYTAR